MTKQGREPRIEALRDVLARMEHCLCELDRLEAGVAAPRLAHAVSDLKFEIERCVETITPEDKSTQRAARL